MTSVEIHFQTERPLDDAVLSRLPATSAIYGIHKIHVAPSLDSVTVEYDATRLRPAEVHAALARAGVPLAALALEAG
jgi:hypothetical protein